VRRRGPGRLIESDDGPNALVGTPKADGSYGYGGADHVRGRNGGHALGLGGGEDEDHGGYGDDFIGAVDGSKDDISRDPGSDRARAHPGDNLA
jgi:hypothetical protein